MLKFILYKSNARGIEKEEAVFWARVLDAIPVVIEKFLLLRGVPHSGGRAGSQECKALAMEVPLLGVLPLMQEHEGEEAANHRTVLFILEHLHEFPVGGGFACNAEGGRATHGDGEERARYKAKPCILG